MKKEMIAGVMLIAGLGTTVHAEEMVLPSPEQARTAFADMFGDAKMFANSQVVLGTCLQIPKPPHPGQVSCTVSVLTPGGSSETQADFYTKSGRWISQPATRHDLPFPDPKLMSARWVPPSPKR